MKSDRRLVVSQMLGHAYAVIFGSTSGTYWSNNPLTTASQNRLRTYTVGPFWRGVKHTVPWAIAVMCVCVLRGVWCIVLHVSCQEQLRQRQGKETKASQGTACDPRLDAAYGTEQPRRNTDLVGFTCIYTNLHTHLQSSQRMETILLILLMIKSELHQQWHFLWCDSYISCSN